MRRREAITLLGAAAAAWPLAARGQQGGRLRRVAVLMSQAGGDQEAKDREAALRDGLQKLGWVEGVNIRMDIRHAGGSDSRLQSQAIELARQGPDVLVASATSALTALRKATSTIPIVFAQVTDPVGAGFVRSLARPGGNITGFTQHEFSIGVKWLELLKELAPRTEHAAVIYDPANLTTAGYLSEIKSGASTLNVQIFGHGVRDAPEIERALGGVAARPNCGFVVLPGPAPSVRRDLVIALAERHRLPAVYPFRYWVARGGLAFYGIDNIDLHRRAASYVDRILKGEKPAELPVQHATKFELVINLRTARTLGLDPPVTLLARTDEVIE
jgi:putative ABC transport system substrate-binding protein